MTEHECCNLNMAELVNMINHYMVEEQDSQSANINYYNSHDLIRLNAYLANIVRLVDHIHEQGTLDMPKTSPKRCVIDEMTVIKKVSNEMVATINNYFEALRDEILLSESCRLKTGFMPHDEVRVRAVVASMVRYIEDYVSNSSPIDLPESSPQEAITDLDAK